MCDSNTNTTTQSIADYLAQLLKDRKQLAAFPNVFLHVERLIDEGKKIYWNFKNWYRKLNPNGNDRAKLKNKNQLLLTKFFATLIKE